MLRIFRATWRSVIRWYPFTRISHGGRRIEQKRAARIFTWELAGEERKGGGGGTPANLAATPVRLAAGK
jgi:hypothetical protein